MKKMALIVTFAVGIGLLMMPRLDGQSSGNYPDFANYLVAGVLSGHPAEPKFKPGATEWPDADPRFRETVRVNLARGANFAGNWTIVQTTCGTGCSYVVVVDARTGEIFEHLPFRMVVIGAPNEYLGLSFRPDSRLLIVEGFINGSRIPTRTYYEWLGRRFRVLRSIRLASNLAR